jgi:hypothetical protein
MTQRIISGTSQEAILDGDMAVDVLAGADLYEPGITCCDLRPAVLNSSTQ